MSEIVQPLSIGSILGGHSTWTSTWNESIRKLTIKIADARRGIVSPLNVNVVFHVPGNIAKPEFKGSRTGRFSRRESLLLVQVALPEIPPMDVDAYLKTQLVEALKEADQWARKKQIASDLSQLMRILEGIDS